MNKYTFIIGAPIVVLLVLITLWGMQIQEVYECHKWASEAERYPDYYILPWQKMQCDIHDITINAPVQS